MYEMAVNGPMRPRLSFNMTFEGDVCPRTNGFEMQIGRGFLVLHVPNRDLSKPE
jgi:hypothetical protein